MKKIKKDKEEPYKISATIYTNEELEKLNHNLENDLDKIVQQVTEAVLINREHIILQKVIEKQQKEIEKLEERLKEERDFNKSALETLKECIHKDRLKELREIDNIDLIQCKIKALLG